MMNLIENLPSFASSEMKLRFLSDEEKTFKTNEKELPLVIQPVAEKNFLTITTLVKKHNKWFNQQLDRYGAILFRGFEVKTAEQFQTILELLNIKLESYYHFGTAVRTRFTDKVFTSSSAPPKLPRKVLTAFGNMVDIRKLKAVTID